MIVDTCIANMEGNAGLKKFFSTLPDQITMQIQQQQQDHKGSFFVEEAGTRLAEMTYSMAGDSLMIIDHTEVDDALRGKNVGYQLVKAAVEYARNHQLTIMPLCPFAKSVFERRKEELGDVLKH